MRTFFVVLALISTLLKYTRKRRKVYETVDLATLVFVALQVCGAYST